MHVITNKSQFRRFSSSPLNWPYWYWTILFHTFGFVAVFLLLFNLLPGGLLPGTATRPADLFWLGNALAGWGILFLLAAGPTVAGFGLYNISLGYLPSSVANLIVTLDRPLPP